MILLIISLNEAVCCRIRSIANQYACILTTFDADDISNNISDIYLEVMNKYLYLLSHLLINAMLIFLFFQSSNSSSYIQDAAQLLVPILQLSVI